MITWFWILILPATWAYADSACVDLFSKKKISPLEWRTSEVREFWTGQLFREDIQNHDYLRESVASIFRTVDEPISLEFSKSLRENSYPRETYGERPAEGLLWGKFDPLSIPITRQLLGILSYSKLGRRLITAALQQMAQTQPYVSPLTIQLKFDTHWPYLGLYDHPSNTVYLHADSTVAQQLLTLAHELTHAVDAKHLPQPHQTTKTEFLFREHRAHLTEHLIQIELKAAFPDLPKGVWDTVAPLNEAQFIETMKTPRYSIPEEIINSYFSTHEWHSLPTHPNHP